MRLMATTCGREVFMVEVPRGQRDQFVWSRLRAKLRERGLEPTRYKAWDAAPGLTFAEAKRIFNEAVDAENAKC
jgi:hypothetical protein